MAFGLKQVAHDRFELSRQALSFTVGLVFSLNLVAQSADVVSKLSQLDAQFQQPVLRRLQLARQIAVVSSQL